METGHEEKDRDLLCKRKKVLQMGRSEDQRRERDGSRLCLLIDDEIRSALHSRTLCHSARPFHPSLFLFAWRTKGDTHLPPCQPTSPARCLSLRSLFHVLSEHIQLTRQRSASLHCRSIQSLLSLHSLHNTTLGIVGTLNSQA